MVAGEKQLAHVFLWPLCALWTHRICNEGILIKIRISGIAPPLPGPRFSSQYYHPRKSLKSKKNSSFWEEPCKHVSLHPGQRWCTPVVPALRRPGSLQAEFHNSQGYTVETLSWKKTNKLIFSIGYEATQTSNSSNQKVEAGGLTYWHEFRARLVLHSECQT